MVAQPFPFFFFFGTNKWINWRSPSKASICISLGIINPANADWAHKEVRKETCTFGICVQTKERLGERREWQAKGVKRALWLIIQKQSSSWAEADVRRAHHRAASAPVAVPTTPPLPVRGFVKSGTGFCSDDSRRCQLGVGWARDQEEAEATWKTVWSQPRTPPPSSFFSSRVSSRQVGPRKLIAHDYYKTSESINSASRQAGLASGSDSMCSFPNNNLPRYCREWIAFSGDQRSSTRRRMARRWWDWATDGSPAQRMGAQ